MPDDMVTIHVGCKRLTDEEAVAAAKEGKTVWTWCSNGLDNWIEMRFAHADAIAYLLPYDPVDMPEDSDEWLGEEPHVEKILLLHQLRQAYTHLWGFADGMSSPTLADLCEDRQQQGRVKLLMDKEELDIGMTWDQIAEAIGCGPGKEPEGILNDG